MAATYSWALTESYLGKNDDPSSFETQNDMRFKTVAENTDLKSVNYDQGGYRIQNYDDIGVLDLNLVHNPDASFTIEFTAKELGDALYTDKAVNYITFGYHIRGRSDVTVSVGRDVGQPYVIISVIRESDTIKSTIRDTKFVTLPNEEYVYTLTYNSFATDDEKIKLYRDFDLISSSATLDVQNLSIVDRKLFLGSSGWINEPSWNNTFDVIQDTVFLNEINFHTNKVLDKEFSPGTPRYPVHYSLTNITDSARNTKNMATTGDVLELKFHSIFDIPSSAVSLIVEGASNIVRTNVDNSFPTTDYAGEQIVSKLYTFQLTATSSNLNEFFSYGVNMDGSETPSNIIPPTGNLYVDNTPASIGFSVQAPSAHNVSVVFDSLVDNMYTDMQLPNFNDYSIVFYASNATDVKSNEIPGSSMTLGTTYFIEGLADESFYNVYATVTDPVSQTSDRILPTVTEQSLIETNDITQPVIVSITPSTTRKDSDFSPGVKVDVSAYDTATQNGNTYDLFVGVFNHELAGDDTAKAATILANNIYAETKSNHAAETFSMDVFSMFDDQMAALPVAPETELYIYCLARDQSNNEIVSVASFTIYNTLTFVSFASDYTDDANIAKQGNTLTLQFESAFRLFNADNLDIKILDSTVVPTSTNGVQWTAEKLVTLSHPSGPAQFSATNGTSGQPGSSFTDVYNVYVQTVDPTITAGYTFSPNLLAINVNNIADYIDDFTINSNDNAFGLEITAGGTTFTSNYNVKADVPDVISLPNLIENTAYDVRATITNVFDQSKQVNLGTVTTLFDTPSVTVVAGAGRTSDGEPTVDIKNASVVSENTTAFDLYVEMTNFPINNLEAASNFFLNTAGMTKRSENTPPAENIALNTLSQASFMKYWTSNDVSGFVGDNTLVPTNNSIYYLTALVNDGRAPLAYSTDSVEFSYRITDASLSNSTNGYYVRNSDTVVLEWSTFFRSYPENYSNLRIFDVPATPTSPDTFTWRAEVSLPASGSISDSHTMFYLGSNVSIDDTHILLDNYPTTFDVTNVGVTVDSITMKLENLYDRGYSGDTVPTGINDLFHVEYSASNAAGKVTYPAQDLSFTNMGLTNFVLDGLQEFTTYSVEFTVTDPAENVSTIGFEGGNVISTAEPNVPIITNAYATFSNIEGTNRIIASNIGAYDVQSEFNVYIGVLSTSNYLDYLNSNTLKDFAGTGVFVAENNPKSSDYQYFDAELATSLYYDISTAVWRKRNILYEAEHYVIAFAEDIYGNSAWVNNAQLGVVFTGEAPIPEEAIEIPPETSATAGMETLSGADTNIQFQEVANDDGTVTYEGVDATGNTSNNIVINAISNPFNSDSLTGEQSLDMGLVVDGVELPQSTYTDSNLTYSLNIKKVDGTFGSGTVLFESSTDPDVALTITDETLTLSTNNEHINTYLVNPNTTEADSWNNITLSQEVVEESTQFQVFINGNELYPSQVTGTSTSVNTDGSVLRIPAQTDMLVDGIVIYNSPANITTVSQLGNTAIFKVKLDFEDAFVVEFDTKLHQDRFIFNDDMNRPGLILNKNVVYTFNQTNEGLPLIFSATGEYPIPDTDTINVNYYLNDVLIGNDPTRYAQEFFASPKNKVVLRPADDDYTMYYHSTDTQVVPPKFVTLGTGDSKLHNKATTATGMQPNYLTTPKFTSNTVAGSYSMLFNKQNEDYLFFNNLNMDANSMTMSMWINPADTLDADNGMPLIAQKNAFEFGLDKDGKMYFDVLRNDTVATIFNDKGGAFMSDSGIGVSNITLKSPIQSNTYLYAMASIEKYDKLTALQLMDQFKDTNLVHQATFTSSSSTGLSPIELTSVLATDKSTILNADAVTRANMYVGFRYTTDNFAYGTSNDYREYVAISADTSTRMTLQNESITLLNSVLTIRPTVSLFNNTNAVQKVTAFCVLLNEDGSFGPNNIFLNDVLVKGFANSSDFATNLSTNTAANAVYDSTVSVAPKAFAVVNNIALTRAFTDVLSTSSASSVALVETSTYALCVVAEDATNSQVVQMVNCNNVLKARYWKLSVDNSGTFYRRDNNTTTGWTIGGLFAYNEPHTLTGVTKDDKMDMNLYNDDSLYNPATMPNNSRPSYNVKNASATEQVWNPSDGSFNSHTVVWDGYQGMNFGLAPSGADPHVLFDFGEAKPLNEIMVMPYSGSIGGYMPVSMKISYSSDGVDFVHEKTWTYTGHNDDVNTQIPKVGQAEADQPDSSGHIGSGQPIDCMVFQRDASTKEWNDKGAVQWFTQPRGHSSWSSVPVVEESSDAPPLATVAIMNTSTTFSFETALGAAGVFYDPSDSSSVSGTTLTDKSSNGINATLSSADKYDSATKSVNVSDEDSITITGVSFMSSTQSYSFWMKGTGDQDGHVTLFNMSGGYTIDFNYNEFIMYGTPKSNDAALRHTVSGYASPYTFENNLGTDWNHICIVVEYSSSTHQTIYVNGVNVKTEALTIPNVDLTTSTQNINISSVLHDGNRMNILFGAFGVFNIALTQDQVTSLYNMHQPIYQPNATPSSSLTYGSSDSITLTNATIRDVTMELNRYLYFSFQLDNAFKVGGEALTEDAVKAFVTSADFVADLSTLITNGAVVEYTTPIAVGDALEITDAQVSKVFTSLTYTSGTTTPSAINASANYAKVLVVEDNVLNSIYGTDSLYAMSIFTALPFDKSVYSSSNGSLSQETVTTAIFDRQAQTNARFQLGKVTLPNGDNFYGPREAVSNNWISSVGMFIDNNYNSVQRMRPNRATYNEGGSNWYPCEYYYEPATFRKVNKCTVYFNHVTNYIDRVHSVGYVDNGAFRSVASSSKALPYLIGSHSPAKNYTGAGGGIEFTFDPIVIGPNRPGRLRIEQNNDDMSTAEIQFEYKYSQAEQSAILGDWAALPYASKYRISMKAIVDVSNGDFRGTELAFVGEYLEPTEEYLPHTSYTENPSGYSILRDGTTSQPHVSQLPNADMYRVFEIQYSSDVSIKQIYVGSTDHNPHNNSRSYDKEIKIEAWNGSAYVPHSTVIWEDLSDANGVTRATSGDNYFPWQPSYNKTEDVRVYPLVGGRGKQILRYDINQARWYHYVAYGYEPSRDSSGSISWPKSFDYDGTGDKTVY